jgi:chorismate-pyruvate lyase
MKLLVAAFSLIAFNALAMESLAEMKRMANDSIGKEMTSLNTHKSCVNNAKTVDAFKACGYSMDESQKMQVEEDRIMDKTKDLKKSY